MSVRAKFKVNEKSQYENGYQIKLSAVYDDNPDSENGKFFKYTPAGQISLSLVNANAATNFEVGKEYYVDFTLAE